MKYNSTKQAEKPVLLQELEQLLKNARQAFGQERVYRRVIALLFAELLTLGRHTWTQLMRTLGLVEHDWSAVYRLFSHARFDERAVGNHLCQETLQHVPAVEPYVTTVDAVIIPRSGQKVAGSSWWRGQRTARFRRGLERGQRFVEVAWLTPSEDGYCRAIPLRWLAAVTEKAIAAVAQPKKEWEAGLEALAWVRERLNLAGRAAQTLVGILDGNYDVPGIWKALPQNCVLLIRAARNRVFYRLPSTQRTGPGRPPLYGERYLAPHEYLKQRQKKHWQTLKLNIRGRERTMNYRVLGPGVVEGAPNQPLWLIIVRGQSYRVGKRNPRQRYRKPTYYLVNAVSRDGTWSLPYSSAQLLTWAWQRWECEVAHREMKSGLRIGDKQCWGPRSALAAIQWGVWVYGITVLAAYRAWGITHGPRRAGRWYTHATRWSITGLWQAYRHAILDYCEFRPLYAPSLAEWFKIDTWLTGLGNALADAGAI